MNSMTGHGWGETSQDGLKVTVEVGSVNRKQSEVSISLPRDLEMLEAQVRDEVNRKIARGRVSVRINIETAEGQEGSRIRLNRPLAEAYVRQLRELASDLKLSGELSVELLMRAPGVLESNSTVHDAEALWPAIQKALTQALSLMLKMRTREGANLKKDLAERIATMRKAVARVRKEAPMVQKRYREQLLARVRAAGLEELQIDEERVSKEIVFFADRSDISEELTRLQSHFQQFEDCVKSAEPVGRTLDFLAQEMNREINTIGSKANDSAISRDVVALKTELEKFREQAQNVE